MLIKGANLNKSQRTQVLAAFGYRWTHENKQRAVNWLGRTGQPTIPLETDAVWLASHCFHFLANGSRLMLNRRGETRHAEPVYLQG